MRQPELSIPQIFLVHDGPSAFERVRAFLSHFGLENSLVSISHSRDMEKILAPAHDQNVGHRVVVVDSGSPAAVDVLEVMERTEETETCPVLVCGGSRRMRAAAIRHHWSVSASDQQPFGIAHIREALDLSGIDLSRHVVPSRFAINHDVV